MEKLFSFSEAKKNTQTHKKIKEMFIRDDSIVTRSNIYLFLAFLSNRCLRLTVLFIFIQFHFNQMENRFPLGGILLFYPLSIFENGSVDQAQHSVYFYINLTIYDRVKVYKRAQKLSQIHRQNRTKFGL